MTSTSQSVRKYFTSGPATFRQRESCRQMSELNFVFEVFFCIWSLVQLQLEQKPAAECR